MSQTGPATTRLRDAPPEPLTSSFAVTHAMVLNVLERGALHGADPVADWKKHNENLSRRTAYLNDKRYYALKFKGPDTDLTVGLADDHWWEGGASTAKNGITCNPNIPTEEVFTTPHALRVDGHVRASKPLAHQGSLIDGIEVRFEAGRIIEARATRGEAVLQKLLDSDEGARRLGEVALVPHSSPISKSGILFYNTLYDENAACHIALGHAPRRRKRLLASMARCDPLMAMHTSCRQTWEDSR